MSVPEIGARMDNPVSGSLLADALFHEGFFAPKQFHGQLVVRGLEEGLELVTDEGRLRLAAHVGRPWARPGFFFGCAVEAHIVPARRVAEMDTPSGGGAQPSRRTSAATTTAAVSFFDKVHLGGDVVGDDEDVVFVVVVVLNLLNVGVTRHKGIRAGPSSAVSARIAFQRMQAASAPHGHAKVLLLLLSEC